MGISTTARTNSSSTGFERSRQELNGILRDDRFDRPSRLLRLQGWRGPTVEEAIAAGSAHRLAPGFCAVGATAIAFTGSWPLALALMATAVTGIFARNHPIESIYNRLAPSIGRTPLPRNRAVEEIGIC